MAEKVATFAVTFDGSAGNLDQVLAGVKSRFKTAISEIESATKQLELFGNLQEQTKKASDAFFKAQEAAANFRQEIARVEASGGKVGKELTDSLKVAEKAAAAASKEYNRSSVQLDKLDVSLKKAGVDTKNFAAETTRLAAAQKAATAAATEQEARQALGLKTLKDIAPEINKLHAAYNTLRASGTLSFKEIALAQQQLQAKTAELRGSLTGVGTALQAVKGVDLGGFFQSAIGPALGFVGVVAAVVTGLKSAITASRDFQQGVSEIGAVTNLTKAQLDQLGAGARALSIELGIGVGDALKGIFDLLRSGVPAENVLDVLRVSAQAAKASLTDIATGVKVANLLIDSFGAELDDLPELFDKLIKGAHDGGATLKEFADGGGALLNVARSAGVSFDELIAVLTVLVDKSGNAERSVGDLTKIIAKLDTAEARNKLRDLGITGDSLVDIFQQIGERGLSLGEVLGLNLTGAGVKSAASLATLTSNAKELPEELDRITTAAGETKKSIDAMFDSPKERSARFNAQLEELEISIGNLVGSGSKVQVFATEVVRQLNVVAGAWEAMLVDFSKTDQVAGKAAASLKTQSEALKAVAENAKAAAIVLKKANQDFDDFSAKLITDIQAIQAALARDISDAAARADAQVAALDRSRQAEAASAAATLEIQLKLAADRLALIVDAEKKITEAVEFQIVAREKRAKQQGDDEKKIAADSANARIAALAPVLAQYQAHYNALIGIAQAASAKFQVAEQARIEIAKSVSDALRTIALEGLSGLDQYAERQKQIDRLISEGRRKAAEGDIAAAKQFFDQAIAESNGLSKVINDNGVEVVTALQSRTDRVAALKKISDAANESIGDQGQAAKKGADQAIIQADLVGLKIKELQDKYDGLKRTAAEGLTMKVTTDEKSVRDAVAKLDELTKPRTVTVTVNVVGGQDVPGGFEAGPQAGFSGGGLVQGFAGGGSVFRRPLWRKVPGAGSGDTVPALLEQGAFVVRKAASSMYGDGLMGRVVRGFAAGGTVTKDEVRRWAQDKWGYDPFAGRPAYTGNAPVIDPRVGFRTGDSFQSAEPPISIDTRPIPDEWINAANVITYAREMLLSVGTLNPLLGSLGPAITDGITQVERNPNDSEAIRRLLQAAETIGSNPYLFSMWGKTQSSASVMPATWFVDWMERRGFTPGQGGGGIGFSKEASQYAMRFFRSSPVANANPLLFAQGGNTSDTVPAMLTPGEWVIPRPAVQSIVRNFGSGFLQSINLGRISPGLLSSMFSPPRVRGYADGGLVAGAAAPRLPAGTAPVSHPTTINMNVSVADIFSESNIKRHFVPAWNNIQRRSR